jgi:2-polyprenyl-3-methyl-5-hydroxy-6-metoxy-1,4-benzoquinol methylase
MSVEFYDHNSESFFVQTVSADMSAAQNRFLQHVPKGGRILDAGCGSGRDAKAFVEQGYEVEAFDASAEMVRLAAAHTGLPIRQMTFQDMQWNRYFDGIWASASLLHVPRAELLGIMSKFTRALRTGGMWYVSFKHGASDREKDGRHFTDLTEEALRTELKAMQDLEVVEVWVSQDVRPNRASEFWLNSLIRRVALASNLEEC